MKKAIVLWTGGKDSCLALHLARESGWTIVALVTFVPVGGTEFKAHPQSEILLQASHLRLQHEFVQITEPYRESYIAALKNLKNRFDVEGFITGDIDLVAGHRNWILECCQGLDVNVVRPLWHMSRKTVLENILMRGIRARISYINHPSIPSSWLNRVINETLVEELNGLASRTGIDLAGENGEYHTMVDFADEG